MLSRAFRRQMAPYARSRWLSWFRGDALSLFPETPAYSLEFTVMTWYIPFKFAIISRKNSLIPSSV